MTKENARTRCSRPPPSPCASTLAGDYSYKSCAKFCNATKGTKHCSFCKCSDCPFCLADRAAATPTYTPGRGGKSRGNLAVELTYNPLDR